MDKYEKMDWWFNDLTPERLPLYLSKYYICVVLIVSTIGALIGLSELLGFWWALLIYFAIYIPAGLAGATVPEIIKEIWRRNERHEQHIS